MRMTWGGVPITFWGGISVGFTQRVQGLRGDTRASPIPVPHTHSIGGGGRDFGWDKVQSPGRTECLGNAAPAHTHTHTPPPRPQGSPQSSHRNALWVEEPTRSRASGAANIAGSPHCPPKTRLLPHQGPVTPLCPTPRVGEPPGREAGGFAAGMAMEAMAGTGGGRGWQRNRLHWHQFGRDGPEGNINPPTCPRQPAPPLPAPCQAAPGPRLPLAGQGPRQGHGTGDTGVG